MNEAHTEDGSGTVATIALVMVGGILATMVLAWSTLFAHQTRLQMVADLAALAGADISATAQWEDVGSRPCRIAREVAGRNGVKVHDCYVQGVDTYVIVQDSLEVAGLSADLLARARAGVDLE